MGPDELTDEAGLGLVEVMVSMLLFALLMAMTIGLLISAITTSARNSTISSATQWAAEQVDSAHVAVAGLDASKACPKWDAVRTAAAPADRTDGRGLGMHAIVTATAAPATCATSTTTPVVTYTVTIVRSSDHTKVLATAKTTIALGLE